MSATPGTASKRASKQYRRFAGPSTYLFLLPAVALFVVFIAYPIVWVLGESFFSVGRDRVNHFVGLDTYLSVVADPVFWIVVRNMFLWGLITIPVQMIIGGTIAYFIERHTNRCRGCFRAMCFLLVVRW